MVRDRCNACACICPIASHDHPPSVSVLCRYIAKFRSAPAEHPKRVAKVVAQVEKWKKSGRKTFMCTARPGWMSLSPRHPGYKKHLFTVDCELVDILGLDEDAGIVRVEPSVNILQMLDYLLPRGYTLPVIPEMDELTIGGLVNGYGIETSSVKHGLFQDICVGFELVCIDCC